MPPDLRLSVIIPNHNYAHYVGDAIASALNILWPNLEVIVVDDGSTDGSMEVIDGFGDKVIAIRQDNSGQMLSCVNGFSRSSGNLIVFLDSDDMLHPDMMREIASVWSDYASKYQFQMRIIDKEGKPTGNILPQYFAPPSPQDIRDWMTRTGAYPTPPGSGNAYPRWFVEKVFMSQTGFVDRAPDSFLLSAAPACGDVITIVKQLASYRVHGENHGAFLTLDDARFSRELVLTSRRYDFFASFIESGTRALNATALNRNLTYLSLRAASYRLRPDIHPIKSDRVFKIIIDSFRAYWVSQGFSKTQQTSLLIWIVSVMCCPARIVRPIVASRYAAARRSRFLTYLLRMLRVVR